MADGRRWVEEEFFPDEFLWLGRWNDVVCDVWVNSGGDFDVGESLLRFLEGD